MEGRGRETPLAVNGGEGRGRLEEMYLALGWLGEVKRGDMMCITSG